MSALSKIKVLDLSRVLAGPWSTQILADLGAEVVKVEQPGKGDDTRAWGPPYLDSELEGEDRESAYFACANRGKKSICVDIKSIEGQALVRRLAETSDVVVENYKYGALAKYGLDYDSLRSVNPKLIYCSITGFGHTGPYRHRPGYDFLMQAMGGLMSVTGKRDEEGGEPLKAGVAVTDILTGLYATIGILAALAERETSGLGQHVDLALFDVTLACLANQASSYLIGGVDPQRLGNDHPNVVPYQSFATKDGHMVVAVGNDEQFERFCDVVGRADLAHDERFKTNSMRVKNRKALTPILSDCLRERDRDDWLARLERVSVPAGPINTVPEALNDQQAIARGMRIDLPHPLREALPLVGNPIMLSRTPIQYKAGPPTLGEHTNKL